MKIRKALLVVMKRWQVTPYRLAQASGTDRATIGKLLRGGHQSASWDKVEKLANGFEQIDPIAKDAFIGALQRPDSTYPNLTDNTIDLVWERETPESIASMMVVLEEYKLLDQERLQKFKAKLAEKDAETNAIMLTTVEDFISSRMLHKRREQEGL